jgi:hypothetical protein
MTEQLKKLFYDVKTGFVSEKKLYDKAKEQGIKITHKEVKDFLGRQNVNQVFKKVERQKYYSSIVEDKIRDNFQIDIMVYDRYEYHKYKYILVVEDIYSRYAEARAMTTRENPTIMKNLLSMFKIMGTPNKISCDNEFNTKEFEKYCGEHDITLELSEPNDIQKNSIVERFNRTLAGYIKKLREGKKIYDWVGNLGNIMDNYNNSYHRMDNYNNSYHRTIRDTPFNIFFKNHDNKQDIIIVPRHFNVGDKVRLKIKKTTFNKGDVLTYSKHIYTIVKIEKYKLINKFLRRKIWKIS